MIANLRDTLVLSTLVEALTIVAFTLYTVSLHNTVKVAWSGSPNVTPQLWLHLHKFDFTHTIVLSFTKFNVAHDTQAPCCTARFREFLRSDATSWGGTWQLWFNSYGNVSNYCVNANKVKDIVPFTLLLFWQRLRHKFNYPTHAQYIIQLRTYVKNCKTGWYRISPGSTTGAFWAAKTLQILPVRTKITHLLYIGYNINMKEEG